MKAPSIDPSPATGSAAVGTGFPRSTYRLQLRPGFGFAEAAALLPYFERLGVSHLYLSPILQAHPGSAHGYDLIDHNAVNPDLGSEADLRRLAEGMAARGGGLIMDFVPNHMGVDDARLNDWWWDVLENGTASPYARFFDVDWDPVKPELRGKVLLPILGDQYGRVLERGELRLEFEDGALQVRYYERLFPINPRRSPLLFRHDIDVLELRLGSDDPDLRELLSILTALDNLPSRLETDRASVFERQREKEVSRERLKRLTERSPAIGAHIDACLEHFNGVPGRPTSFRPLHNLLEQQAYRLAYWRTAFHEINYRRFFDVNGLASLRMEDPEVFETAHHLLIQMVGSGTLSGVRLDHVDGLYDPGAYTTRLRGALEHAREAAGRAKDPPVYMVVEKILSPGETLPPWPIQGTTGYDFLTDLNGLFLDPRGRRPLLRAYQRFSPRLTAFEDVAYAGKKVVMESTLASEVNMLAHALNRISEDDPRSRDFTLNSLRDMLVEVVACFPVYRTYLTHSGHGAGDARVIEAAMTEARRRNPAMDVSIFDFLEGVLLDRSAGLLAPEERARRRDFALKFQQYTGPVQAKGVEDTAFYRYNLLVSMNEVGGAPQSFGCAPAAFHARNRERLEHWPHAMLCTATHDTKRGEDVRARLNVLSEIAEDWSRAVSRWARLNAANRTRVGGDWAPDRNDEYLFYQTLVGAWPLGEVDRDVLAERLRTYMLKAVREAKVHTSWINENREYEQAVTAFVDGALLGRRAKRFLEAFLPFQHRVARAGMVNGLAQVVLKMAAPGIPDFYQGSEDWDFSLVDPDNRRDVDFARRVAAADAILPLLDEARPVAERTAGIGTLLATWEDGRIKALVTAAGLRLRAAHPGLFEAGDYLPLEADDVLTEHVVAFVRRHGDEALLAAVPRLAVRLAGDKPPLGTDAWGAGKLRLPPHLMERRWQCALTGRAWPARQALPLADLFETCPVALLVSGGSAAGSR